MYLEYNHFPTLFDVGQHRQGALDGGYVDVLDSINGTPLPSPSILTGSVVLELTTAEPVHADQGTLDVGDTQLRLKL